MEISLREDCAVFLQHVAEICCENSQQISQQFSQQSAASDLAMRIFRRRKVGRVASTHRRIFRRCKVGRVASTRGNILAIVSEFKFAKFWRARYRLYRSRCLQVSFRFSILCKLYKSYASFAQLQTKHFAKLWLKNRLLVASRRRARSCLLASLLRIS